MSKYVLMPDQKVLVSLFYSPSKEEFFFLVCLSKFEKNEPDFFQKIEEGYWVGVTSEQKPLSVCSSNFMLDVYNSLHEALESEKMEFIEEQRELAMAHRT